MQWKSHSNRHSHTLVCLVCSCFLLKERSKKSKTQCSHLSIQQVVTFHHYWLLPLSLSPSHSLYELLNVFFTQSLKRNRKKKYKNCYNCILWLWTWRTIKVYIYKSWEFTLNCLLKVVCRIRMQAPLHPNRIGNLIVHSLLLLNWLGDK